MDLNNYYLVKAFSKYEYMTEFNNGNVYLNNSSYFWNLENSFQQDNEGVIFQPEGNLYIFQSSKNVPEILKNYSNSKDAIEHLCKENLGKVIAEISNPIISLDRYLCCFYLLPKKDVSMANDSITFITEKERNDLEQFLINYLNASNAHDVYACIYNVATFLNIFSNAMINKGYSINYRQIEYKDIDGKTKLSLLKNGDIESLIFVKPTKFSYQKEFRIALTKSGDYSKTSILEKVEGIEKSIICWFQCNYKKNMSI